MIKLSREGLHFRRHGDTILLRWPWAQGTRFSSSLYAYDFNNFRDYWLHVGGLEGALRSAEKTERIRGLRMSELLAYYAAHKYAGEHVVVMYDIDPSKKDSAFWKRIPRHQAEQLIKDVAVFRCRDRSEMLHVVQGTPPEFATAYAFENGTIVDCNQWRD